MKKIVALMLISVMSLGMVACGGKDDSSKVDNSETTTTPEITEEVNDGEIVEPEEVYNSALDILNNTLAKYAEEEKFAVIGGDYENMIDGAPGEIDVTKAEELNSQFGFPVENVDMVEDGASMMHMMNQNTFTTVVYQLKSHENVTAFADAAKEMIMSRQWMCGFPEKLTINQVGLKYVTVTYGAADIVDTFDGHLKEAHELIENLYTEELTR